ncbi:chorismate-binding protein [Microbispora hainanensis]|uniref:Chorismate-binding protein n=1 Tax=Microbispora hainanensis TaxID=568844 RepID=A0ABZ1T2A5_9ACTN|nr:MULTISPECIES: chorismate-binding protein [Microbispora]NJP28037.1 anthranilate synthase component I family protein [Microbispora sp. CL1-1]TQS10381.1 anthranilate synthase component I family protein [Microbispora sp. SCL1-1]
MYDAFAHIGGHLATGLREVTTDLAALDGSGWWAVVVSYEGKVVCARFDDVRRAPLPRPRGPWRGPGRDAWATSLDREGYERGVQRIRDYIEQGEVYQANLCRVLSAPLPSPDADPLALAVRLAEGNPAPYAAVVDVPGLTVVSASPELYLSRRGEVIESRPIKGTGVTADDLLDKDYAENLMIVDLVRNDLGRVAEVGSVTVPSLFAVEEHPGLVHLVSTVRARLDGGAGWPELFAATFPPGSVTGAPKSSALRIINELEPEPRGPYCGAVGWVDADRREGALAVGIRTFWIEHDTIRFGTGAGITWGSDPGREWRETELKAARLIGLASGGRSEDGPRHR